MAFEQGHPKLEGCGRPKGAVTACREIRAKRRENALKYSFEQQERIMALETAIMEDAELRPYDRYRLLVDIERIRQQEMTSSVPAEQNLKIEDEGGIRSSRSLLMEKMEKMDSNNPTEQK